MSFAYFYSGVFKHKAYFDDGYIKEREDIEGVFISDFKISSNEDYLVIRDDIFNHICENYNIKERDRDRYEILIKDFNFLHEV